MKTMVWVKCMNGVVWFFLILFVLTLFTLPYLIGEYMRLAGAHPAHLVGLKFFLYATAIPFLVLLIVAKKICRNLLHGNPFCDSNVRGLRVISLCAFLDFILYALVTFTIWGNLLTLTITVAAFMVGLVALILAQVVELALEIKQESDLTI